MFDQLFSVGDDPEVNTSDDVEDSDDAMLEVID